MIVSHAKQFVVLRPWKTASQSVAARLAPYADGPYDAFFHFNPHLNRVVHQHFTRADLAALPEGRLGYRTAAFVRNPYDRAYSGFRQLKQDIAAQPHMAYPEAWVRDLVMAQLADNFAQLARAGFRFDAWLDLVGDGQVYEAGRNTSFPLHPAHYWTHAGGRPAVDFVGRVEAFEADFGRLLGLVGIDAVDRVNVNVADLEGAAATNPGGYRYVDRMSGRSVAKINRLFAADFDLFGYERLDP